MEEKGIHVLAADLGGTSARCGVFLVREKALVPLEIRIEPAAKFADFERFLTQVFPSPHVHLHAACLAAAGPVAQGRVRLTNLPWEVDATIVAPLLGLPSHRVAVINDLEAIARAIPTLPQESLATLQPGRTMPGNIALLAAGTGLGEAGLIWDGVGHVPFAGEGGHADFAPRDEVEWELARELAGRFGRTSWERVVSGPGLVDLYLFLARRATPPALNLIHRLPSPEAAAAVVEAALGAHCGVATEAVDRFVALLGAEASNLALKLLARGGVFLGGGIPPKLLPRLQSEVFLESFLAKGRMRPLLESLPVHVILDDTAGLRGAAALAAQLATG